MNFVTEILLISQFIFTVIAGMYFFNCLKQQNGGKSSVKINCQKEVSKLTDLRSIKLSKPLSEQTRPEDFSEIVGQEQGIKALKAALCGSNPQHIIIYGPPGVGKTAAARIALEEAKKSKNTPFRKNAPFIEVDATILQFDERSIADPLMGSVHDPIYQGAGAYGSAGIPQPKMGAVTKAHGGVLFIDEIGELHSVQMNKLLKVLEDRKVFLTSSYYSEDDTNIPDYIHDIFKNGLPADFRLIGATTRLPEEIPQALRSRCTEIYFKRLTPECVSEIAINSCKRAGVDYENNIDKIVSKYSANGRDTVNIIQTAVSIASFEERKNIMLKDIEEVVEMGKYAPVIDIKAKYENISGLVYGLAVYGASNGTIIEIETLAEPAENKGNGIFKVTGIVEEEEIRSKNGVMIRKSAAKSSVENVLTVIKNITKIDCKDYNIHVNFPGGMPVDGPSAGIAIFCSIYSAITKKNIRPLMAMTGEIGIKGGVKPVGGVSDKIEAAVRSGIKTVIIPAENWQSVYEKYNINICKAEKIEDVIECAFSA